MNDNEQKTVEEIAMLVFPQVYGHPSCCNKAFCPMPPSPQLLAQLYAGFLALKQPVGWGEARTPTLFGVRRSYYVGVSLSPPTYKNER